MDELVRHAIANQARFDTKEEAIAYAERNGIAYRVEEPKPEARKILSYSDNFAPNRIVPWSH